MQEHYEWVARIIDSCYTGFHIDCAKKLIECFKERYGETEQWQSLLEKMSTKEAMHMVV